MKNSAAFSLVILLLHNLSFIAIHHVIAQDSTTNQTKLIFLVPKRDELSDFVKIKNGEYSGFAIEVFEYAAAEAIPPSFFTHRFETYEMKEGDPNGTFDGMLRKLQQSKEYAGAVGEITITEDRMDWVDFTTPYLDTRIGILVRDTSTEDGKTVSMTYLTPVTKIILVLVATIGFSILVVVVLWLMKLCKSSHKSSSSQSPGTILGSIMYAKLVVILILMVLLLVVASYVPRQTLLSVPTQQRRNIKSLDDLQRMGSRVGYRQGAFVKELLRNKNFREPDIIPVDSDAEIFDKLKRGSQDGIGIDGYVSGMHHLKLFQEKHCGNFTLVPDFSLKSAGLAFAFQQGSIHVKGFSEEIVRMIDNGKMAEIQSRTIGDLDNICEFHETKTSVGSSYQDRIALWLPVACAIYVVVLVITMLLGYLGLLMKK